MLHTIPQTGDEVVYENWLGGTYTPARVLSVSRFLVDHEHGPIVVDEATIEAVGFEPTGVTITVPVECIEYAADYEPVGGLYPLIGDFGAS